MISCRAVANILAADELAAASGWKKIGVRLHLAICRHCSRFAQQLATIRKIAHGFMAEVESGSVPADLEQRLLKRIRREA